MYTKRQSRSNVAYNLFIDRYISLFNSCFPFRKRKRIIKLEKVRPWFTDELKELNDEKQRNYFLHINNKRNTHLKLNYNKSRNVYFRKVKAAKREYYQKHLNAVRNDVKGSWKVINSVLGRNSTKDTSRLSVDGKEITDKSQIATELNSYFSKVADNLVKKIPDCKWRKPFNRYLGSPNQRTLKLTAFHPKDILKVLKDMSSKSSSGWDSIPQK